MNTKLTLESLTDWIETVKEAAKNDISFSITRFKPTTETPFSIVAGWQKMFTNNDFSDLFCVSKSHPEYVMCVKIVINEDNTCPDFELMNMPTDKFGEVDDTCIPLEWNDNPECAAEFFLHEWERLMENYKEEL